jgi:4-hydroxyphenylpyruvate dioxygenase
MGPFPHTAPRATISAENPAGTDGFEFVEFAHPNPDELRALFSRMGYTLTARHRTRAIELWQQGDITYLLNDEPGSHARRFVETHGPCAPAMCWRVADAAHAFSHAVALGAEPYTAADRALDLPAIVGIGGSLIYFTDRYGDGTTPYDTEFEWLAAPKLAGVGFHYLDHLTHNVHRGNMDTGLRCSRTCRSAGHCPARAGRKVLPRFADPAATSPMPPCDADTLQDGGQSGVTFAAFVGESLLPGFPVQDGGRV